MKLNWNFLGAMGCKTLHYSAVHCIALHCIAVQPSMGEEVCIFSGTTVTCIFCMSGHDVRGRLSLS